MINAISSTMDELLQESKIHVSETVLRLKKVYIFKNHRELIEQGQTFLEQVLKRAAQLILVQDVVQIVHELTNKQVGVLVDKYNTPTSHSVQHKCFSQVCPWSLVNYDGEFYFIPHHCSRSVYFTSPETGWLPGVTASPRFFFRKSLNQVLFQGVLTE
jgi:membrane-associated PAP2 superfamily phosphatase